MDISLILKETISIKSSEEFVQLAPVFDNSVPHINWDNFTWYESLMSGLAETAPLHGFVYFINKWHLVFLSCTRNSICKVLRTSLPA